MRFEQVSAHAFGRLHESDLQLGPGFNLIWGANEAGKSTWHDALYAGLCGLRRGKGRMKKEDEAFADRRRPWGRDAWRVSVRIVLADGRTVEIRQDLDGRVDCKAVDVTLGHDLSAEIINEGTPDGARWLGLDRRSFLATACVRQADLLRVRDDDSAGYLQTFLQKAAAGAGSDATVAAALDHIEAFRREQVGLRKNSSRPLPAARRREEKAAAALKKARAEHREFLTLTVQADRARDGADAAARELARARAARARRFADDLAVRVDRARHLSARFVAGAPPESAPESALPGAATAVLKAWERRPRDVSVLTGASSDELRREIERLPGVPDGDDEAHPSVVAAFGQWNSSRRQLDLHRGDPGDGAGAPSGTPDRATLLATEAESTRNAGRSLLAGGAAALAMAALLLAADWTGLFLWVMLAAGAALGAGGVLRLRDASRARQRLSVWQQRRMELERQAQAAATALSAALNDRGAAVSDDVQADHAAYLESCSRRREEAARAASRHRLEEQLDNRLAAERAAAEERERLASTRAALHETADVCGVPAGDDTTRAAALAAWIRDNEERRRRRETELREWTELQQILDGETVAALDSRLQQAQGEADRLAADAAGPAESAGVADSGDGAIAALAARDDLRQETVRRQQLRDAAAQEADRLDGMVQDRAGRLTPVAEAEAELAFAGSERRRLERLDSILERTRGYLQAAQDRVHRDIAPVLNGTLAEWLPSVTGNRYREALVDPESLNVKVRDETGEWRPATGLSHGTTEMVYLLLRVALARHLTATGEVCPLLLDDVTVQCDAGRTRQALQVLHAISREHQIILFSQEEEVLRWARDHLQAPADRLLELAPPGRAETAFDGPDALRA